MTDVLQFVVLQLAALFVLPLLVMKLYATPHWPSVLAGYFAPLSHQYSLWFLAGWVAARQSPFGGERDRSQRD